MHEIEWTECHPCFKQSQVNLLQAGSYSHACCSVAIIIKPRITSRAFISLHFSSFGFSCLPFLLGVFPSRVLQSTDNFSISALVCWRNIAITCPYKAMVVLVCGTCSFTLLKALANKDRQRKGSTFIKAHCSPAD